MNQEVFPEQEKRNAPTVNLEQMKVYKMFIKRLDSSLYNHYGNPLKCENHGTSSPEECQAGWECSNPAKPKICLVQLSLTLI